MLGSGSDLIRALLTTLSPLKQPPPPSPLLAASWTKAQRKRNRWVSVVKYVSSTNEIDYRRRIRSTTFIIPSRLLPMALKPMKVTSFTSAFMVVGRF